MTTLPLCPECRCPVLGIEETTETMSWPLAVPGEMTIKRVVHRLMPCGHELREGFHDDQ